MSFALLGAGAVAVGLVGVVVVTVAPGRERLPRERRRPAQVDGEGALAGAAEAASGLMGRLIRRRSSQLAVSLDLAGIRMRPQDFAVLVAIAAIVAIALGVLLGRGLLAVPAGASAVLLAAVIVRSRAAKRRKQFASQLDDSLQLMASSLRAGQSMMQALASTARESEEPSASELTRIVNETRVGRPVIDALEEAADRMQSEDFRWATQAIAINREVGGSLADVLDGVARTIRERGQVRRQVAALSAEGRLSGVILMLLPIVVAGFITLTNPSYLLPFIEEPIGPIIIGFAVVLMVVGGIWMKKTVEVEF
ncbi:type II secretion system F family protein [Agrococcus sp. ARC_14]|uniref:type II secretion system F family protein n=1 Tax=Agrococcus sp. ARC_14 TaxID=2919927 RepID=UPI001F052C09|nr:type II secretion system F family protein [Agrococcus sp. ARC_14]MCH1883724.1 type II secretion system F family protein [Agrococcus sp. ARC_14]